MKIRSSQSSPAQYKLFGQLSDSKVMQIGLLSDFQKIDAYVPGQADTLGSQCAL